MGGTKNTFVPFLNGLFQPFTMTYITNLKSYIFFSCLGAFHKKKDIFVRVSKLSTHYSGSKQVDIEFLLNKLTCIWDVCFLNRLSRSYLSLMDLGSKSINQSIIRYDVFIKRITQIVNSQNLNGWIRLGLIYF